MVPSRIRTRKFRIYYVLEPEPLSLSKTSLHRTSRNHVPATTQNTVPRPQKCYTRDVCARYHSQREIIREMCAQGVQREGASLEKLRRPSRSFPLTNIESKASQWLSILNKQTMMEAVGMRKLSGGGRLWLHHEGGCGCSPAWLQAALVMRSGLEGSTVTCLSRISWIFKWVRETWSLLLPVPPRVSSFSSLSFSVMQSLIFHPIWNVH